jgi:S1-C subfamily serine protease
VCAACDRPHHRAIVPAAERVWLHEHRRLVGAAVLAALLVFLYAVVDSRAPGPAPTARAPARVATLSSPRQDEQPASVFGVVGGAADEFGLRDVRGYAFVVRSTGGTTDLLTDYHLIAAPYLAGERTVDLQRGGDTYSAQIVTVSPDPHVALLRMNGTFEALPTSPRPPAAGDAVTLFSGGAMRHAAVVPYAGRGGAVHLTFSVEVPNGDAGAPVLDGVGAVVGVADPSAPFGASGIGFAVPIAAACAAVEDC